MLRRIFTIIAILAGIGVIVLTQTMLRDHIQGIITERTNNANERDKQKARALKDETILATTSNNLLRTQGTLASTTSDLEKTKGELTSLSGAHERTVAQLHGERLAAAVSLVKALGGGWQPPVTKAQ